MNDVLGIQNRRENSTLRNNKVGHRPECKPKSGPDFGWIRHMGHGSWTLTPYNSPLIEAGQVWFELCCLEAVRVRGNTLESLPGVKCVGWCPTPLELILFWQGFWLRSLVWVWFVSHLVHPQTEPVFPSVCPSLWLPKSLLTHFLRNKLNKTKCFKTMLLKHWLYLLLNWQIFELESLTFI